MRIDSFDPLREPSSLDPEDPDSLDPSAPEDYLRMKDWIRQAQLDAERARAGKEPTRKQDRDP